MRICDRKKAVRKIASVHHEFGYRGQRQRTLGTDYRALSCSHRPVAGQKRDKLYLRNGPQGRGDSGYSLIKVLYDFL